MPFLMFAWIPKIDSFLAKYDYWLHRLVQIGVVTLLIGIILYPKFPFIRIPNTYVAIRIEDFLLLIVLGIWVLWQRAKLLELLSSSVVQAIILFLAIGWLATFSGIFVTQTVDPSLGVLHTIRRFQYLVMFFIVWTSIKTREDAWYYLKVIAISSLFVFIFGFGQKNLGWPVVSTMNKEYSSGIAQTIMPGGRINSTFAGHYDLAAYSVMMLNLVAGLLVAVKHWPSRILLWMVTVANFWILIASASRISFAAYLGSITLTLWFLKKKLWIIPVLAISILASRNAPGLLDRYAETFRYEFAPRLAAIEWPWEKWGQIAVGPEPTPTPPIIASAEPTPTRDPNMPVTSLTATPTPVAGTTEPPGGAPGGGVPVVYEDRSTAIRFEVEWPRALRAFYKSPLLGTGYSSITLATDNDYLRALGETGLLGLLSFMLIFLTLFNAARSMIFSKQLQSEHAVVVGIVGATLGFLANALFIDVFEASKIAIFYWALAGILYALANIELFEKTKLAFAMANYHLGLRKWILRQLEIIRQFFHKQ